MFASIRAVVVSVVMAGVVLAADISGKWIFTVETDAGSGSPSFVFKQAGEKLTGTYSGTFGTAELAGTVKGEDVVFSLEVAVGDQKGTITYKGKIDGDAKMHGSVELAGLGSGTWTGVKQ